MDRRVFIKKCGLGLAGIIAAGKAPAGIVRSLLGAGSTKYVSKEGLAPTAADYVQEGLMALFDGIENAGYGVHDDSIEYWKDLTGNGQDCRSNGSLPIPLIRSNCIEFDATNRSFVFDFCADLKSTRFIGITFEMCMDFTVWKQKTNPNIFTATPLNSPTVPYRGAFVAREAASQLVMANKSTQTLTGLAIPRKSFSVTTSASAATLYFSGEQTGAFSMNFSANPTLESGIFGFAVSEHMNNPNGGKIFCSRFYNRVLSSDEIAYNHEVDKRRFGI